MSVWAKVVVALAVVVIVAVGITQVARRTAPTAPTAQPTERVAPEQAKDEPEAPRLALRYEEIVERSPFKPLVTAPRAAEGGGNGGGPAETANPTPQNSSPREPAGPAAPPDPLADLALTGVVEIGRELRALLENVKTHVGDYVGVGEEFSGFRVVEIRETEVELEKDGKRHTLRMGDKKLPAGPSSSSSSAPTEKAATGASGRPRGGPGLGGPPTGEFGEDMLKWAEKMPLRQLEQFYSAYSGQLSPTERKQAEEYLEQRRRREGR